MDAIRQLIASLFANKSKLLVMILSSVIFAFLLFPFGDLTDLVSNQVAKLSGNSVYLALENMKLSFIPRPGMTLEKVYLETNKLAGLSVQELTITPSVSGLAAQKPYGHISAVGLLGGNVDLQVSKGAPTENGLERHRLELKAQKVHLADIRSLASLPVLLKGQLQLDSQMLVDLSFQEQPDVDIKLNLNNFEMPPSNLNTAMGPIALPDLKLGQVELKGRLASGRFIIESGKLGSSNDELSGTLKGSIEMRLQNAGGRPIPVFGSYNLDVDLTAKQSFQDKAGLFLAFLGSYRRDTANGANFRFKVSGLNIQTPPNIEAVR